MDTVFDDPSAGTGEGQGTGASAINTAGVIAGAYGDSAGVAHGFVRATDGTLTEFDAPDAGTGESKGTYPRGINKAGTIVGEYTDSSDTSHGFVRNAKTGKITEFSAPDAAGGTFMSLTIPGVYLNNGPLINTAGDIVGYYKDGIGAYHGFVRAADGTITEFDAPGAGTAESEGTVAAGINATGTIVGSYRDSSNIWHGFIRATDGTFTDINAERARRGDRAPLRSASTTPAWCVGPMETRAGPPRDLCARAAAS